jgi:putative flippase GtrA
MRSTSAEVARFVAAGAATTAASYLVYLAMLLVSPYPVAYSVSFAAGIVMSYSLNALVVFHRPWSWRGLLAFPLVYLLQYAAGLVLLAVLVGGLAVDARVAPLISTVLLLPATFLLSRRIVKGRARV